ncbi:DNA polymerase alpha subunit B [Geosmithia morbida]|uniref:DNA polymerase alpha subunit B n=1 Tax=Geosmithia morbida TaxID=1094350 RepID=A0A9P5CYI0_9HYPO|nr:DNA polymerase alpha subunit B [Geosmithia morbida]KAF4120453.1 DNA polymerase alpha subunit B [Geosmithia morbida]
MADQLQSRFSPNKALEPDILAELQSMMRLHDLSVEDLYLKWDSYCLRMETDADVVTLQGIRGLKQTIQDTLERENSTGTSSNVGRKKPGHGGSRQQPHAAPRAGAAGGSDVFGMLDGMVPSTPSGGRLGKSGGGAGSLRKKAVDGTPRAAGPASSPAAGRNMGEQLESMASPATSFADRNKPGEVVEILNSHLAASEAPLAPYSEPRIKLKVASDQTKMAYKPLAMKLSEASEILDDRIDEFAAVVQEHHQLEDSAFGSAASQSTTPIVAVGRIASDSMEGRLNAASLVLETSRRTGMGLRVPLDLAKVRGGWSFFPGQIVALKGSNASGKSFVVDEILEMPLLPSAASSVSAIDAHRQKLMADPDAMVDDDEDGAVPAPLNIIFAAGPYTADDNLDFEPLHSLCGQAADTYADAVVLMGPLMDIDHPLLASGDFDLPDEAGADADTATMSTAFRYMFAPALQRLAASNPSVTIILVPSVRDVLDKHVSWPQDTIPRHKELGLPKAARIVSNPMALQMNESVVALSSLDILYEIKGEELVKGGGAAGSSGSAPPDPMARLCRHLIEQRHYFPLFPPMDRSRLPKVGAADGRATGAVLDVSYLKLGEMVNVRPDVMITPSTLPPFTKVVESVVAINPGPLSKRRGAGTYARMSLHAPSTDNQEVLEGMVGHRVFERARVEIVRI